MSIYLDYNATAPLLPSVIDVMSESLRTGAHNPSSVHSFGRNAKMQLEAARNVVAEAVSVFPNEVIFTGSGTESNNMVLRGFPDYALMASTIEHSSIDKPASRLGADRLAVDAQGRVDIEALEAKLKHLDRKPLVSVMLVNNETGIIQDIAAIAKVVHEADGLLHCDAAQAIGKMPVDMGMLGADMLTLCAHKVGGPVGVGALVIAQNKVIAPMLLGGGQELGRRAGTENIPAIVGFAEMLKATMNNGCAPMQKLREWLDGMEAEIMDAVPDAIIASGEAPRVGNTSCVLMPQISSETQLMHCDLEGFAVSAGSACSSGKIAASHVLKAMGFDVQQASTALRISAGWDTKESDIQSFTKTWIALYKRLSQKKAS